jgi:hypothetical protein
MVAEPVMPAPSAERELVSAPTVAAEAAMEAVSGMMCKGVPAESVPAEAAASVFVAAMVSPSEPAPLTPFVVTASAMSKFVGKPAAAVMPVSAVESAMPGPAKFRLSALMPVSMTFVARPAMSAASARSVTKATMMMVASVMSGPGETIARPAPLAALASVSLLLAAVARLRGPSFPVTIAAVTLATVTLATVTLATVTAARLFVPHVAVGVVSASATLGVFARSPLTMFSLAPYSLIPFGKLTHPAFAAARPRSLVVVVAIRIAVASSGVISPRSAGPFASSVIALGIAIIAAVVRHFFRAQFVRRQTSPIPVGRELHQRGRRDSAKKQQHVSSHFRLPFNPLATRLRSVAARVTLSGLP